MKHGRSLYWRIFAYIFALMLCTILIVSSLAYLIAKRSLLNQADVSLGTTAASLASALEHTKDTDSAVTAIQALSQSSETTDLWLRVWREGDTADLSDDVGHAQSTTQTVEILRAYTHAVPNTGDQLYTTIPHAGEDLRVVWRVEETQLGKIHIVVGVPSSQIGSELKAMHRALFWLVVALALASAWLARVVTRSALEPIQATSRKIESMSLEHLGQDVSGLADVPKELRPFSEVVIRLLERVRSAMEREKQLIDDASHDLRTPLACAMSTVELALASPPEKAQDRQALQEVGEDLTRLHHLMAQLLVLARLDDAPVHTGSPIDLRRPLMQAAQDVERSTKPPTNSVIQVQIEQGFWVQSDESDLLRLFSNLMANAVLHGPPGAPVIVEATPRDNRIEISITDQGGQIPASEIEHLFDRFSRRDSSRSSATHGTGLGLAICRQIVERWSGSISMTSSPEQGTTVTVSFRVSSPSPDATEA